MITEEVDFSFVTLRGERELLIAIPQDQVDASHFDIALFRHIKREYIAGPMTGYEKWNFPAFDAARDKRLELGIQVISPADMDRQRGFDENVATEFTPTDFATAMRLDTWALLNVTGIFMLRGWSVSRGATYELKVAEMIGLDIEFDDDAERGVA